MTKWLIHVIPRQSLPAQLQREQAKYTQYTVDFSMFNSLVVSDLLGAALGSGGS